jgi:extracellular factor (EF) 3-hydroxypalmitic acid methyl ester biosynthesis protein
MGESSSIPEPSADPRIESPSVTPAPSVFAFVAWVETSLSSLPSRVADVGQSLAIAEAVALLEAVDRYQRGLPEPARLAFEALFRARIKPLFLQAEIIRYAAARPRGYPGDFACMERIWKGRTLPETHGQLGRTSLGRVLNRVVLELANCVANELRVYFLAEWIGRLRPGAVVASLGSGSAIEVAYACRQGLCPSGLTVHLFDLDDGAHAAARKRLAPWDVRLVCHSGDAINSVLAYAGERFDLAYSSGMFDYFDVSWARRLVARLWQRVADGGALIVTNAHPDNPTRFLLEWGCDWYLKYKTASELRSLAQDLEGVASAEVTRDARGVYQYLEVVGGGPQGRPSA